MSTKSTKSPPTASSSKLSKIFHKSNNRDRAKSASDPSSNSPQPPPPSNDSSDPSPEPDLPPAIPRPARQSRTRSERPLSTASELLPSRSLHSSPSTSKLGDLPTRISGWFNHTFSSSTNDLSLPNILSQSHSTGSSSSPKVKLPSSFLTAIPGRAVRYIFDTDATAGKCTDSIWLLGIQHPGYEPPLPTSRPSPLPTRQDGQNQRISGSPRSIQSATLSLSGSSSNSSMHDIPEYVQPLGSNKLGWPTAFYADFTSRIWLTYRSNFPPIKDGRLADLGCGSSVPASPPVGACTDAASIRGGETSPSSSRIRAWPWSSTAEKGWTTDAGWGCMLRTGQSLLANAMIHLHLGRDWRRPPYAIYTADYASYVQILTWFFDTPAIEAPFSVHRMALAGKELGTEVGQWFGPSTAAGAIKTLVLGFPECGLGVAVATDSALYQSEVYTASHGGSTHARSPRKLVKTTWGDRPVLLLFGVRLGIDRVNPIYYDTIKQLYTFPQSVGIAGGRPSSSYYFVGVQANNLFYLDPHQPRHVIPLRLPPPLPPYMYPESSAESDREQSISSDHCAKPSRSPSQRQRRRQHHQSDHTRIPTSPASVRTSSSTFSYHAPTSPSPLQQQHSTSSTASTTSTDFSLSSSPGGGTHSYPHPLLPRHASRKSPPPVAHAKFHSHMESSRRQSSEVDSRDSPNGNQGSSIGHASFTSGGVGGSSIASSLIGGLDPLQQHYATAYSFAELKTYHCDHVRKLPMSGLDPSMLIGFLCHDEADWVDFRRRVAELPKPVFSVQDEPPRWPDEFEDDMGLMESVSSEADDIEQGEEIGDEGDEGEGDGIEGEEGEEEEGDGVKVEVELPGGEGDGDAGSDEFFDTRSTSSAEGPPDKAVLVGHSGAALPGRTIISTRSSTEEDPADPVTPGPGSRFSLPGDKPIGKGGDEEEEDDDWVDSSFVTPGPTGSRPRTVKLVVTGATPIRGEESQLPVLVEQSSSVQFPTMSAATDETKNGPTAGTKKGKSKRKQGDLALPVVRAPASVSSRSLSSSKSKGKSKSGHTKSRHRRGEPSEATDDQEHYLFPAAGDDGDDDYFVDGAEHATPLDRSRNNTVVAGGGEDAMVVLSGGRRMNNVRARDGGRTQSGGVKGVLTE